jgi:hypothetical protein
MSERLPVSLAQWGVLPRLALAAGATIFIWLMLAGLL